ncbi:sugar-binding domain-containing protein [Thermophagus xiamenensis]|uniref:Sialate O-acetylesterase n=1 Tax=Thermophagus xiamenensis TaxID=385682 RepID=A0A1I1WJM2_9BACT|nr:sugar-binding domain-containing protein [Thermophagus xiamenensis]SFD93290.1 sialate O-acetylesterase [Thermophagus xiamenensis]
MRTFLTILYLTLLFGPMVYAYQPREEYRQILNLEGDWKFMIGDDPKRAEPGFDDRSWETIHVPSSWENQGFHGYDGYAWYRKTFILPPDYKDASLMLFLGYIDDVDEVYVNGQKIGHKGSFPPYFFTAYNAERRYIIPAGLINFNGYNTIAVRVYDAQLDGGIMKGNIGIYQRIRDLVPDIELEGYWKFQTGDNKIWASPDYDDSQWFDILAPGLWEDQYGKHYDGFAWYRKQIMVPASFSGKRFVLMLGKIDDIDEVYINGKLVAHTGQMYDDPSRNHADSEYSRQRYYYLDENDLIPGKVNTIAVRVFDIGEGGGIYEGPLGLIELRRFVSYWRSR